ncbi:hypothetical protein [Cytobacillus stercorigallinarum]|nr:hypothetical protein [Cytobacillus stercorigallinarum]
MFVNVRMKSENSRYPLSSSKFNIAEAALPTALQLMIALVFNKRRK